MKNPRLALIGYWLVLGISGCSQNSDQSLAQGDQLSTYEQQASKGGALIRIQDYELSPVKLDYGQAKAKIRKVQRGKQISFFLVISKSQGYDDDLSAFIAYNDLIEIEKAFAVLKNELPSDVAAEPEFLNKKFITEDDFQLGYYCIKRQSKWYFSVSPFTTDNAFVIKDPLSIDILFKEAKDLYKSLK